jgi:hypothetical protein
MEKITPHYMIVYIPNYFCSTPAIGYRQYNKEFWLDDGDIYSEQEIRDKYPEAVFLSDSDMFSLFDVVISILRPGSKG